MLMAAKKASPFSSASFFSRPGKGRTVTKYRKSQIVFSQGAPGDAVYYLQKGKLKVTVVSNRGKEAAAVPDVVVSTQLKKLGGQLTSG